MYFSIQDVHITQYFKNISRHLFLHCLTGRLQHPPAYFDIRVTFLHSDVTLLTPVWTPGVLQEPVALARTAVLCTIVVPHHCQNVVQIPIINAGIVDDSAGVMSQWFNLIQKNKVKKSFSDTEKCTVYLHSASPQLGFS